MPIKGSRPEVVAAADTAKTEGIKRASEIHGIPYSTVKNYIDKHRIPIPRNNRVNKMNLELSVLCVVAANQCPKTGLPLETIAEVCGVSKQAISMIEHRALKKLRNNPEIKSMIEHLLK